MKKETKEKDEDIDTSFLANCKTTKRLFKIMKKEFYHPTYRELNTMYQFTGLSTALFGCLNHIPFIHVNYLYVERESAFHVYQYLWRAKGIFSIWNPKTKDMHIIDEVRSKTKLNEFVIIRPKGKRHLISMVASPRKALEDLKWESRIGCGTVFESDLVEIEEKIKLKKEQGRESKKGNEELGELLFSMRGRSRKESGRVGAFF